MLYHPSIALTFGSDMILLGQVSKSGSPTNNRAVIQPSTKLTFTFSFGSYSLCSMICQKSSGIVQKSEITFCCMCVRVF